MPSAYRFSAFGEKTSSAIALSITAAASLLAVDPSQGPKAPQLLYSISSLVPRISPEGGSVMDDRPSVSSPTSQYDDFLFASICEEANGMRLSVLSALARMNVDPWDEATRLAAMPKAVAERTLVSILDLVSGRRWKSVGSKGRCCAIGSASPAAGRWCDNCGGRRCKSRRASDKLLVGVGGLCDSDIASLTTPPRDNDGRRRVRVQIQRDIPVEER